MENKGGPKCDTLIKPHTRKSGNIVFTDFLDFLLLQTTVEQLETSILGGENRKKFCCNCGEQGHFVHVSLKILLNNNIFIAKRSTHTESFSFHLNFIPNTRIFKRAA